MKVTLIALLIAVASVGCTGLRGASIKPSVTNGWLECRVRYGNANSIAAAVMTVPETETVIWRWIRIRDGFTGKVFECGKVTPEMRQRPLRLQVSWQYDDIFAASMLTHNYFFLITKDDKVIDIPQEKEDLSNKRSHRTRLSSAQSVR